MKLSLSPSLLDGAYMSALEDIVHDENKVSTVRMAEWVGSDTLLFRWCGGSD